MKYDIIVVGSGPGGYVAAIRAAQLGKKVAIVEKADLGGVCLNWGCIPTKALLKSAQVFSYCKNAAHYGVAVEGEVKPDFEKIVARSRTVAETMSKGVAFLMKKNNIDVINGFGRLAGDGKVDVDGTTYEADAIILATGARPRQMPFMPVDGQHVITSKEALVLPKLPASMIVVGSGAIGSEFACLYASLGVKVTVIEYMPQMMPLEDEEVAKTMERSFRKMRVTVLTSTNVKSVTVGEDGMCNVEIEGKKAVVLGRSNIVGLPVSKLLLDRNATVTMCHSRTKNLAEVTREADILVVAIGRPKFVTADMVGEGAAVIDVGVNRDPETGKLCGDVDFAACAEKASVITPVPGGCGPMTRACLMENTIECYLNQVAK